MRDRAKSFLAPHQISIRQFANNQKFPAVPVTAKVIPGPQRAPGLAGTHIVQDIGSWVSRKKRPCYLLGQKWCTTRPIIITNNGVREIKTKTPKKSIFRQSMLDHP